MTQAVYLALFAVLLCVCVGLAWLCWKLIKDLSGVQARHKQRVEELSTELADALDYQQEVAAVLDSYVGGISKRISESAAIAEVIYARSPQTFQVDRGLAYWMHANHQFLHRLYAVSVRHIDGGHRRRVHEVRNTGRDGIFKRIYTNAGLPAPFEQDEGLL